MSHSTPAKTVAFSPMRPPHASFKNTLDNPIKLKWPEVPKQSIEALMVELKNCLEGVKVSTTRSNKTHKKMSKKRKRNMKTVASSPETKGEGSGDNDEAKQTVDSEPTLEEPSAKKQRLEDDKPVSALISQSSSDPHCSSDTTTPQLQTHTEDTSLRQCEVPSNSSVTGSLSLSKRSQMIVGVNAVSRCLERSGLEGLRGGLVCLSAQPALILRHLMMLAATRGVPFIALPNLSQTAAPLLGVKTALAIGFKKVFSNDEADHFTQMVKKITKLAPPINLPWLTVTREPSSTPPPGQQSVSEDTVERHDTSDGANSSSDMTTSSTTLEQEHALEEVSWQTEKTEKTLTATKQREEVQTEHQAKSRGQYLPLQIKRVLVTSKRKRK